jgi:UDP-3-O-[3-hydroxymyristoyl] glucosamine N-acyltransferase
MGANATIGGSTIIGENCMIGGLCGVADNLVIADRVTVSPVSFIFKSIKKAGKYSGSAPLMPRGEWLKASATYKKLSKKD